MGRRIPEIERDIAIVIFKRRWAFGFTSKRLSVFPVRGSYEVRVSYLPGITKETKQNKTKRPWKWIVCKSVAASFCEGLVNGMITTLYTVGTFPGL